ncbi:hypothetical protein [Paenibacillus rigui]|uniref:RNA polymerase subunit sigma n=1 Tax=Paenibacillus rigui TaxID=554312 RepID=A0A229UN26_9BACL|nr:hypothetical protein [Paenibacillus rigui]OXM84695.1 hypothetical protein CF651_19520 [Paenibacillus rigui]
MSMKPVELQFALHKNDEAGLKQNQLNHKPVEDQTQLAEAALKQAERQRQSLSKTEQTNHALIREGAKDSSSKEKKKKKQQASASSDPNRPQPVDRREHPFKGKHIDLTL